MRRTFATSFAMSLVLGGAASGQSFEIGLAPQYTHFDKDAGCPCQHPRDTWSLSGRLGVWVTPTLGFELDGTSASPERAIVGGEMDYRAIALRAVKVLPFAPSGLPVEPIVGAGVVHTDWGHEGHENEWGISALVGARWRLTHFLGLRTDGVADYIPRTKNLNLATRFGVALFLGGRRRPPEPVIATAPQPTPPPPARPPAQPRPVPPPPPPPPPSPVPAPAPAIDTSAITGPIYFDYDRSAIRPDAAAILDRKAAWLRANPGLTIRIEGHADDRGTGEYNAVLGQRRAAAAKRYLVLRGISADRVFLTTLGEGRPACNETPMTEECHQLNRRDDFFIVDTGGSLRSPPRD